MRVFMVFIFTGCAFGNTSLADEQAHISNNTLRILAYNIRHGRGMDDKIDIERIANVISSTSADLVALQEVDKNCNRSGNQDIAAVLGEMLEMEHRFGKFMTYDGGEYGLAVLSRFPILDSKRHELPEGAEPRCALEVMIIPEGYSEPVSFVSIHNDWTDEGIRIRQVEALLSGLKERTGPVILAGDFNARPDGASLTLLTEAGWDMLEKEGDKTTFPADVPDREIDYFYIKNFPDVTTHHVVIEEKVASDHRPIYAEISLNE